MSNDILGWRAWGVLLVAFYMFAPANADAQPGTADMGEVSLLGGGSFGGGAHPAIGGSSGISFSKYVIGLIEASYQPLGQHTLQSWPTPSSVRDSHLWDFDLSLHIRFPIKDRWEPYGIVGVGFLWDHVNQNSIGPSNNPVVYHWDQFNPSFVTGGGLRYYLREDWGIRPQMKVVVSTRIYTQLSIGIFYNSNSF